MLVVDAESDAAADAAIEAAHALLDTRRRLREESGRVLPRTLESAVRRLPDANLATISVPGAYAKLEAMTALRRGLHVFLFSDNVALADEIALKRVATEKGLLCMGPDCGTGYLNGVGLGFANVVPRGRIGCVSASGTGLQAVASRLASLGEGISHGIGVGGRDLSAEVGGVMTAFALETLGADRSTELIVVISKPPAPAALARLEAAIRVIGKPVVVCCLGASAPAGAPGRWVATLEDAAEAADRRRARDAVGPARLRRSRGRADPARAARRGSTARRNAARTLRGRDARARGAAGARRLAGGSRAPPPAAGTGSWISAPTSTRWDGPTRCWIRSSATRWSGRPGAIRAWACSSWTSCWAGGRIRIRRGRWRPRWRTREPRATRAGRELTVVASVIGTAGDPQGLPGQVAALEAAGVHVLPGSAQAARFAALALDPTLGPRLLEARG